MKRTLLTSAAVAASAMILAAPSFASTSLTDIVDPGGPTAIITLAGTTAMTIDEQRLPFTIQFDAIATSAFGSEQPVKYLGEELGQTYDISTIIRELGTDIGAESELIETKIVAGLRGAVETDPTDGMMRVLEVVAYIGDGIDQDADAALIDLTQGDELAKAGTTVTRGATGGGLMKIDFDDQLASAVIDKRGLPGERGLGVASGASVIG